jgi:hypothetical protein
MRHQLHPEADADVRPILGDTMTQEFGYLAQPRRLGLADVSHTHRTAHDDQDILGAEVARQRRACECLDHLNPIPCTGQQLAEHPRTFVGDVGDTDGTRHLVGYSRAGRNRGKSAGIPAADCRLSGSTDPRTKCGFDKASRCRFLDSLNAAGTSVRLPDPIARPLDELRHAASPHLTSAHLALADGSSLERYDFIGPKAAHDFIRIGLFTGIHGDEPAGPIAAARLLAQLISQPHLATGYHLTVYPTINPHGLAAGTRHDEAGFDLNREFWKESSRPAVKLLEQELRAARFQGIIALHADDTCEGLYGYAHGRLLNEELLRPALRASGQHLPMDQRPLIDGFAADESVIHFCFPGVLSAPPDQHPAPFDIILETPAKAPDDSQAAAMVDGVLAILAEYRRFIAFGGDL